MFVNKYKSEKNNSDSVWDVFYKIIDLIII